MIPRSAGETDGPLAPSSAHSSVEIPAIDAMLDDDHPVKQSAAAWAREHIAPPRGAFDHEVWRALADQGAQGQLVEPAYGGRGSGIIEALLTFEGLALGSADNGLIFALASQVFATQRAIGAAASEDQQRRWLPDLCSGRSIGAFAMSEPAAGSDTSAITTTAREIGADRYVLNGTKSWITAGPVADLVVVFATTDPELGRWGLTAFCVDTARDGVTRHPATSKMGLEGSPFGQIDFENCEVDASDRLGPVGAGGGIFSAAVEGERAFLYACQLGSAQRLLEQTILRAREREQFGRPIGANQAVSHRIAEMKLRLETSRLLVYKAAALHARGESLALASALAKVQTSESAVANSLDAMRIHGAEGYTTHLSVEREVRDALGGLAYSGTSDIQRMIIARLLGVDRPIRPDRGTP